jgi:hypothetical protein
MKTFKVTLTKSYIVKIKAENIENAKEFSEFFTGDISDISNDVDKSENNFEIIEIEPTINQVFDVE